MTVHKNLTRQLKIALLSLLPFLQLQLPVKLACPHQPYSLSSDLSLICVLKSKSSPLIAILI